MLAYSTALLSLIYSATGKVVKGTANLAVGAVDGAIDASTRVGRGLRKSSTLSKGLDSNEFSDEEYNDYYG